MLMNFFYYKFILKVYRRLFLFYFFFDTIDIEWYIKKQEVVCQYLET